MQWLTAPIALIVDAATFVFSAAALLGIRSAEPAPLPRSRSSLLAEIRHGVSAMLRDPRLRALIGARATMECSLGIGSAVYLLFVTRELGFRPGVLGLIFAVGGASALLGTMIAEPIGARLGLQRTLAAGMSVTALAALLTPLAHGATWDAAGLLIGQQLLGDAAAVMFGIHETTALVASAPPELRGRVSGASRVANLAATILGALAGGVLAERFGLRSALVVAALVRLAGTAFLWRLEDSRERVVGAPRGDRSANGM